MLTLSAEEDETARWIFYKWEGGQGKEEEEKSRGGGCKELICVHLAVPQEECNHYVLQTRTNKKEAKILEKRTFSI